MFAELAKFLKENKDKIVKKVRTNEVRERRGYSDYTWWMTTVSFDEVETVDYDALLAQIDEFGKQLEQRNEERKQAEAVLVAGRAVSTGRLY